MVPRTIPSLEGDKNETRRGINCVTNSKRDTKNSDVNGNILNKAAERSFFIKINIVTLDVSVQREFILEGYIYISF